MNKEQRTETLKKLGEHKIYGNALRDLLNEKRDGLNNVSGLDTIEEVKGRQEAIVIIDKLISDVFKEIKTPIKKENQYR